MSVARRSRRRLSTQAASPVVSEALEPRRLFSGVLWSQIAKLNPADGAEGDVFGGSVAISGNTALVGSSFDDDNGGNSGSAYLFDITTGTQIAKLKPIDGAARDRFSFSVAISGNTALVGSHDDDDNGPDSGSAYLFDITTGLQIAKLKSIDGAEFDRFGCSVAISGNTALVGSCGDDDNGTDSGSAYLFDITTGLQIAKLKPTDGAASDSFGYSVAISGNTALVGNYRDDDHGTDSGSAYLFDIATGAQIAKLKPADGATRDSFGYSVAISGKTALVGSYRDDDHGTDSGSAYLFDITTGAQIAKLKPADGATDDRFGMSVALSSTVALVGSALDDDNGFGSGSAYLFMFDATAPQVVASAFSFETAQQFVVTFDEAINPASLDLAKVSATRVTAGTASSPTAVTWSQANTVATFTFPLLTDGEYRFTLAAGAVKDVAGHELASDVVNEGPDAFILAADANRDRVVNFADLLIVAQNYGQTGRTLSQGNLDYSPDGLVGFSDLLILAQNYGTSLIRVEPRPPLFGRRAISARTTVEPEETALLA
jgi:esterase/lipase superfamily enzyme